MYLSDVHVLGRAQLDLHVKYFRFSLIIIQSTPITLYDYFEFNVIFLLFIQSNFEFKNMLTSIDVKFIFDSACLSASLGDKGLFISANIL